MESASANFGFAALSLATAALHLFSFLLDSQCGAGATASAHQAPPLLHGAAEFLPPLAAVAVIFVAVASTYRHLMDRRHVAAAAPVPAPGNRRLSTSALLTFLLCVSAGTLQFIFFVQGTAGGAGADHGAQARALGLAALRALPAAATATFFPGMTLIILGHVRSGGEGGGGGAVPGDGPMIQGELVLVRLLNKIAAGAAAALVGLMTMALTLYVGAKY